MNLRGVPATALVGALSLLVIGAAGWLLLVGPARAEIADVRQQVVDVQDANALQGVRLRALEAQAADLDTVSAEADDLAALFPPTADQPGFFAMVDAAARAAGIPLDAVRALSPAAPVAAAPAEGTAASAAGEPAEQGVTLEVEASPERARRMLAALERLDRALLVRSVSTSRDAGDGAPRVTLSITGSTYVAPRLVPPRTGPEGR